MKPASSNIGRDVPPFIADAVVHFSSSLVSIQLAATSQPYVVGSTFDSKELATDLDIEYRAVDDSGLRICFCFLCLVVVGVMGN